MGDRYVLTVKCPECGRVADDVWYAPTSGATEHRCPCGHTIDLEELTGITYEEASNRTEIENLCREVIEAKENQ